MVGDVVGSAGRQIFGRVVTMLRQKGKADFVVVNAENAAGGKGITRALAEELFSAGADVITLGDHTWDRKEVENYLDYEPRILRPLNFAPGCPGHGHVSVRTEWGDVAVVNLVGRVFMHPYDCPFRAIDGLLEKNPDLGRIILVDLHAEATSEKIVMGRYLDGRASAVVGTHTHVQTSDEVVLPHGTAYIPDLGMTGPKDSAIGRDLKSVTAMLLTGMPTRFKLAEDDVKLEGVVIDIESETGLAKRIQRIRMGSES